MAKGRKKLPAPSTEWDKALEVECPVCQRKIGERCVSESNKESMRPHRPRLLVADDPSLATAEQEYQSTLRLQRSGKLFSRDQSAEAVESSAQDLIRQIGSATEALSEELEYITNLYIEAKGKADAYDEIVKAVQNHS